ncbi:ATP-binding cassette domain-containing protein [Actinoplanes sp. NPDC051513]|uniref:ATP-binding cassette domain-containing protein n=1 Tax=Actinoplanes sp. NPDC051513 TaxID=3363908 RepID=UPI0037A7B966
MITATKLAKRYGDRAAVDDLSFEVTPGTVTGFLGPNGAGKSTTMRLMLGLDHGEGETLFDGRRFATIRRPMREIGTVLEARAFHPTRSARNHLRMLAAGSGIDYARVDEVLEMVGLADVARHQPRSFSLGMAQRLGLAQAMLGDPATLVLDEPANGLDPHGIQWLRDILKSLAAEGRTVFVSSHLLPEMALMADRLVVIGRGRMIYQGDVDGFVREFTRSTVVVRSPNADSLVAALSAEGVAAETFEDGALRVSGIEASEVGEAAFRAGIVLHELTTRTASLEAAFMTATGDDTL